jgi:hypothetical protein
MFEYFKTCKYPSCVLCAIIKNAVEKGRKSTIDIKKKCTRKSFLYKKYKWLYLLIEELYEKKPEMFKNGFRKNNPKLFLELSILHKKQEQGIDMCIPTIEQLLVYSEQDSEQSNPDSDYEFWENMLLG